jgi:hypothetical protein
MKKLDTFVGLIVLSALLTLVVVSLSLHSAKAEPTRRVQHDVIILAYGPKYGPITTNVWGDEVLPQVGLQTTWMNRSIGGLDVAEGTELASAIAYLMDNGFTLQPPLIYGQYTFIR